jgi:serine/threonine protein kinase
MGSWLLVFFYPLRVTEHDLVLGMNEKNAVGSGAFGRVRILGLLSGELVAVKKFVNYGSHLSKSLKAEIKTLAKIKYRNIVKILGFCHSDDSISLIFEFLQKGSLGELKSVCRQQFSCFYRPL